MADETTKNATRVSFRVRSGGLYRMINRGKWRRIARRSKTMKLRFRLGQIVIDQAADRTGGAESRSRHQGNSESPDRANKPGSDEPSAGR